MDFDKDKLLQDISRPCPKGGATLPSINKIHRRAHKKMSAEYATKKYETINRHTRLGPLEIELQQSSGSSQSVSLPSLNLTSLDNVGILPRAVDARQKTFCTPRPSSKQLVGGRLVDRNWRDSTSREGKVPVLNSDKLLSTRTDPPPFDPFKSTRRALRPRNDDELDDDKKKLIRRYDGIVDDINK